MPALASVAAGDLLTVAVAYDLSGLSNSSGETLTVQDTLGTTFSEIDDAFDSNPAQGLRTFFGVSAATGTNDDIVISASLAAGFLLAYAGQYAGVSSVVAHTIVLQSSAPTNTDGVTVALSSPDAGTLVWALSFGTQSCEAAYTAGTGFTPRGPAQGIWPYTTFFCAQAEDAPSREGSQVATWTIEDSTDAINAIVLFR